jgi:PKD repeat protein
MLQSSIFPKGIHTRFFGLLLAAASLWGASVAQSQTVSANFGNRSGATPVVPSGLFSANGIGNDVVDPTSISTLTSAGLDRTRFWVPLTQVYATSTANFSVLDYQLEKMQASGLHPLAVIYLTPPSLGSKPCAPPSNIAKWGQMAASVVAHVDQKFPGLMQDYEIWNEPDLASSLCIADATTRLNTYVSMFASAASAMHAQAKDDGQTIRTGGPVISEVALGLTWFPALLNNASAAPYVDFVSFHIYVTGLVNIQNKMTWPDLYAVTQSPAHGIALAYNMLEPLVRKGRQPNAASTPIYISEYNDNWAYAQDCCRNDPTYGPLWNSVAITDLLNTVYSGAKAGPSQLSYFNASGKFFCLLGEWDSAMDCNSSVLEPYPQFYAYKLYASPDYLDLQAGGHMAASVSPASTTSGLEATAFYTGDADSVVVINPTSATYSAVNVVLSNPGLTSSEGTVYLLDRSNGQISSRSVALKAASGSYSAEVEVPPYSTVALSVKGNSTGGRPTAVLDVTPLTGTHPLLVTMDSSPSQGGSTAIIGRTIDFGDGHWQNWTPKVWHTYTIPGTYKILLTIKNQAGQISMASKVITVH